MMFKYCSILPRESLHKLKQYWEWQLRLKQVVSCERFHNIPVPVTPWDGESLLLAQHRGERVWKLIVRCAANTSEDVLRESVRARCALLLFTESLFFREMQLSRAAAEALGLDIFLLCVGRVVAIPQAALFHPSACAEILGFPGTFSILDHSGWAG